MGAATTRFAAEIEQILAFRTCCLTMNSAAPILSGMGRASGLGRRRDDRAGAIGDQFAPISMSFAMRQAAMVDDEMRLHLGLIVPHMRRAMSISKTIESKEAETATFANIFDGLNAGMIIVDANCGHRPRQYRR